MLDYASCYQCHKEIGAGPLFVMTSSPKLRAEAGDMAIANRFQCQECVENMALIAISTAPETAEVVIVRAEPKRDTEGRCLALGSTYGEIALVLSLEQAFAATEDADFATLLEKRDRGRRTASGRLKQGGAA